MDIEYPWNSAPEWAAYAATDITGHANWYDQRPRMGKYGWFPALKADPNKHVFAGRLGGEWCPEWKKSLQERPNI